MRTLVCAVVILSFVPTVSGQRAVPSHAVATPSRRGPYVVVRVNGVEIMSDRLDAAVNRLLPFESFHRTVKADKVAAVREKALQGLIDEELQYQDGVRLGIRATAPEIERAVVQARQRFPNEVAFERRLRASGATTADLRREIRRSLVIRKTADRVVTSKCEVGADEARRYFDAHPERFIVPEQLHVFAITIGVEPSATAAVWANAGKRLENVRRELQHGGPFETLARTYSTDASRPAGGDMGLVHRGSLSDEFERALRDLRPGQVSDVVRTLYGFHLVRLAEIRPPHPKTFDQVATELRRKLTTQRCDEMKTAWIARLRAGAAIVP